VSARECVCVCTRENNPPQFNSVSPGMIQSLYAEEEEFNSFQ
jgi:hypothetical protein